MSNILDLFLVNRSRITTIPCKSYATTTTRSDIWDDEPLVFQLRQELVHPVLRPHLLHHVEQPEQLLDSDGNAVGAQLLQDLCIFLGAAS